jgi:hypothetical protein
MESVIKWHTGEPSSQYMFCVITDVYGHVGIDIWDGEYWLSYHMEDILAWYPLNEIKPYKE